MAEPQDFEAALQEQLTQQQQALREVEKALGAEAGDSELLEVPQLLLLLKQPLACT